MVSFFGGFLTPSRRPIIDRWTATVTVLAGSIAFCLASGVGPDGGEMG